jgi:hypothetical protein
MQNRSAIAMFTMSGILLLFATFASLLPDVLESKSSVLISTSKSSITDYLSTAKNWEGWMFDQSEKDDSWRTLTSGEEQGEGSVLKWFSKIIGDGALEVKSIKNDLIVFERITDNNAYRDRGYLTITEVENGVRLDWIDSLDISTSFMARYYAQDERYINKIDSVNNVMLQSLKLELEK